MCTTLGAAASLTTSDIDDAQVRGSAVIYMEGYLFDPPKAKAAFVHAAEVAHAANRKVSVTLSDSFCVDRHRAAFANLVDSHVDILFANEDEIVSLFNVGSFDEAVQAVRGRCEIACLTRGVAGSVIVAGEEVVEVPAAAVEQVVDTTGAGDLYAAGFLFGWTRGKSHAECGVIGGIVAAEVISHYGARPAVPLSGLLPSG